MRSKRLKIEDYFEKYAKVVYETNRKLAILYAKGGFLGHFANPKVSFARKIAEAKTNIFDYYLEYGNLDNISIPGIGPKIKNELVRIIENGQTKGT